MNDHSSCGESAFEPSLQNEVVVPNNLEFNWNSKSVLHRDLFGFNCIFVDETLSQQAFHLLDGGKRQLR